MKRIFLASLLTLACALAASAQRQDTSAQAEGSNQTSASAGGGDKNINIASGTRLAAQLQNSLDARKAKVGDQVVLKTTEAIKSEGRTAVKKGALLRGHVTSVTQKTKGQAASQVKLVFDQLDNGSLTVPITATISSITQARTQTGDSNDDLFAGQTTTMSLSSTTTTTAQRAPASSGAQNGGLLGGATSTVGSVATGATSTVGSTVNSTTGAAGQTTSGLGQSLGRIQISESSSTSANGSSVLTLQGDNLHLEKGTTFNLLISQSASAGAEKRP